MLYTKYQTRAPIRTSDSDLSFWDYGRLQYVSYTYCGTSERETFYVECLGRTSAYTYAPPIYIIRLKVT